MMANTPLKVFLWCGLGLAVIGYVVACVQSWRRPYHSGQEVVEVYGCRKGERCWQIHRANAGISLGYSEPWPCDQPRTRVDLVGQHSAGDFPSWPVEPILSGIHSWSFTAGLGFSYGPELVRVGPDGTVPLTESAARRATSIRIRFWGCGVNYFWLRRATRFPALTWLLWTSWMIATRLRRWHRAKEGHCPQCGYDLRASTGRCPECGKPVAHLARSISDP
jgi:hypothetical protein